MPKLSERSKDVVRHYISNIAKNITSLEFESLTPNPVLGALLIDGLGFSKKRAFQFVIEQRLERSLVTSVGNMFQQIAMTLAAEATGVEGADIQVGGNGFVYYAQIKSGPNTVNKDIAIQLARNLASATRRHGKAVAVLGICYGRPEDQRFPWAKDNNLQVKIGDDFWRFISDDEVSLKDVIDLVRDVGKERPFRHLSNEMKQKIKLLMTKFEERYVVGRNVDWSR